MQNFVYDIDTKIYFGKNQLDNLIIELNNLGAKKPLIVKGVILCLKLKYLRMAEVRQ